MPLHLRLTCRRINDDSADVFRTKLHELMMQSTFEIRITESMTEAELTRILKSLKPDIEFHKRTWVCNSNSNTQALFAPKLHQVGLIPYDTNASEEDKAQGWKFYLFYKKDLPFRGRMDRDAWEQYAPTHVPGGMVDTEKRALSRSLATKLGFCRGKAVELHKEARDYTLIRGLRRHSITPVLSPAVRRSRTRFYDPWAETDDASCVTPRLSSHRKALGRCVDDSSPQRTS
jgi:hypothetical protein